MESTEKSKILVAIADQQISFLLEKLLVSAGYSVTRASDRAAAQTYMKQGSLSLVIVSDKLNEVDGLSLADEFIHQMPVTPVLLFVNRDAPELLKRAIQIGISDYLCLPLRSEEVLRAVQSCLERANQRREWAIAEARRTSDSLQQKVDELETLERIGRAITSNLDLDGVLSTIVDSAVAALGAEEGNLMLVDDSTGELFMRATKNMDDEFSKTFRMPIQNTLLGSVLSSGQPVLLDEKTPQKIKTSYLVHSLIYVPLISRGHIFGIIGVVNRLTRKTFGERAVKLLQAIAEYAVVALENARLFSDTTAERQKLETVLTRIEDGVVILDQSQRILIINNTVRQAFGFGGQQLTGRMFREVFNQPELLELVRTSADKLTNRTEITADDSRIFSVMHTFIPDVGAALTLHDITYFKKLDKIKGDFVSTVSHDLRSPLTAIMGYVELIERAGPVNERQRDFIRRVHVNIQSITNLLDELLNLGHIESGFDTTREVVNLKQLVDLSVEGCRRMLDMKNILVSVEFPTDFPAINASPVQMRQMIDHLLDNAIKYTPPGGSITIHGGIESEQIILEVSDNGIGIPSVDLPYIFDKFYRAGNLSGNIPGAGLGLAIVHSIVDVHEGRIWVDSMPGKGSRFTIVLPVGKA